MMSKSGFVLLGLGAAVAATAILPAHAGAQTPYCREYTRPVTVGNRVQEGYGTACMQPDGSWQVVNQEPAPTSPHPLDPYAYAPARVIAPAPVYYEPIPAPVAYYDDVYYGYPASSLSLSFGFGDGHWGGHHRHHGKWRHGHGGHGRGHWR